MCHWTRQAPEIRNHNNFSSLFESVSAQRRTRDNSVPDTYHESISPFADGVILMRHVDLNMILDSNQGEVEYVTAKEWNSEGKKWF